MDFFDFCLFFDRLTILILILISALVIYFIRMNQCVVLTPFMAAFWLALPLIEYLVNDAQLSNKYLLIYRFDLYVFFGGIIIIPISLVIIGIVAIAIRKSRKTVPKKNNWFACIILSLFPCCLFYSILMYKGYGFSGFMPTVIVVALLVIDKVILIKLNHFTIQTLIVFIVVVVRSRYIRTHLEFDVLYVITNAMFDYALLQFWKDTTGWENIHLKDKLK